MVEIRCSREAINWPGESPGSSDSLGETAPGGPWIKVKSTRAFSPTGHPGAPESPEGVVAASGRVSPVGQVLGREAGRKEER